LAVRHRAGRDDVGAAELGVLLSFGMLIEEAYIGAAPLGKGSIGFGPDKKGS